MSEPVHHLPARQENRPPAMNLLEDFDKAFRVAEVLASSEMVPKDYQGRPENVLVAMQMGAELGLQPMQAVQNISVINGRPAVWGDLALALVQAHPECEDVQETIEGTGNDRVAVCTVKRRGRKAVSRTFSVADAIRARLWQTSEKVTRYKKNGSGSYQADNDSPWFRYPERMLQMRARGFALRDAFPDALRGISIAEEARDYPQERQVEGEHSFRDQQREREPEPKDRDAALADALRGPQGDAPDPSPSEKANASEAPAEAQDEAAPRAAAESDDQDDGPDLEKAVASLREAIGYIDVPADANPIMEKIKQLPLTKADKDELRAAVREKVKAVGKQ